MGPHNGPMRDEKANQQRAEILREVGEAMFDENWRGPLAKALNWHREHLRECLAQQRQVPDRVWRQLPGLVRNEGQRLITKSSELYNLHDRVKKAVGS